VYKLFKILNDSINMQFVAFWVHLTLYIIRSGDFLWGKMYNIRPFGIKVMNIWSCAYILRVFFFVIVNVKTVLEPV